MAVLQMQRISICALKKNRKAILEKLQSMGVMEVSQFLEEDEDFRRMDTANARSSFERQQPLLTVRWIFFRFTHRRKNPCCLLSPGRIW